MGKKSGTGPTGPRTQRGKSRSSKNSAKHNIFCERILPEEEPEALRLWRGFKQYFHLRGPVEAAIGGDLVLDRLKKKRLNAYAIHEIEAARMHDLVEKTISFEWSFCSEKTAESSGLRQCPIAAVVYLDKLKVDIEGRGLKADEDLARLKVFLQAGTRTPWFAIAIFMTYEQLQRAQRRYESGETKDPPDYDNFKSQVLHDIELAIQFAEAFARVDDRARQFEFGSDSALPPDATLDRILRYDALVERSHNQHLETLEHYRRLRRSGRLSGKEAAARSHEEDDEAA